MSRMPLLLNLVPLKTVKSKKLTWSLDISRVSLMVGSLELRWFRKRRREVSEPSQMTRTSSRYLSQTAGGVPFHSLPG